MPTLASALTKWLVYEFQRSGFRFDRSAARYRDNRTGRFVAESRVMSLVENFSNSVQVNTTNITQRLVDGKIDLRSWQKQMRQEVKDNYIVNITAGRGGRASMTQSDWGRVGARLRQQYGYLDNMAWERFNGTVSLSVCQSSASWRPVSALPIV